MFFTRFECSSLQYSNTAVSFLGLVVPKYDCKFPNQWLTIHFLPQRIFVTNKSLFGDFTLTDMSSQVTDYTRFECSFKFTRFECSFEFTRFECSFKFTRFECSLKFTRFKCNFSFTRFECSFMCPSWPSSSILKWDPASTSWDLQWSWSSLHC